jgi:hypothetical protein
MVTNHHVKGFEREKREINYATIERRKAMHSNQKQSVKHERDAHAGHSKDKRVKTEAKSDGRAWECDRIDRGFCG